MQWFLLILVLPAIIWLQGCSSSRHARSMSRLPPERKTVPRGEIRTESGGNVRHPRVLGDTRTRPPTSRQLPSMTVRPDARPRPSAPVINPQSDWIPLNYWASSQGVGSLQRVSTNQYHLATHWGTFGLAPNARYAIFNGWKIYLGYPLRQTNGVPYIHRLDAERNLRPVVGYYNPLPQRRKTVCIDAGHGGAKGGTKSVLGKFYEKSYSLDWALRLRPLLERKGWRVILTRTDDRDLTIDQRVAIADKHQADLFVSLHFNSAGKGASGLETYCTTPRGMPSTLKRGYSDPMRLILPNNAHDLVNV
ncbi:MAG: N-acetylmuramoyl-L-alanine amidase family protein, partial [Limisphaerales bacterium]